MASGVENEKVTDSPVSMNRHDSYSVTVTSTPRSTDRKIDAQTPERIEVFHLTIEFTQLLHPQTNLRYQNQLIFNSSV